MRHPLRVGGSAGDRSDRTDLLIYVLETDSELEAEYGDTFFWFDAFSVTIFTLEFLLRLYACPAVTKFASQHGRIRYLLTPYALMDFLAILPFFCTALPIYGFYEYFAYFASIGDFITQELSMISREHSEKITGNRKVIVCDDLSALCPIQHDVLCGTS